MKCGLLGRTLGHSYSPQIHALLGDYAYSLYPREPEEVEDFLKNGDWDGLNVTIPYKQTVIPCLDQLTPIARRLGAVNTVVRQKDGSLLGHNTDFFGFQTMLDRSGLEVSGKKVLVLGSGGASRPVCAVLEDRGAQVVVISRTGENHYGNLDRHTDAALIVNTTPVGMAPEVGVSPLSLEGFPNLEGVLDLIYNPARTQLLLDAEKRGLKTENGLWMLVAQAWESAQCFLGTALPEEKIAGVHSAVRRSVENIILVGMPGSGKTTVGQILAQKLGRFLMDSDIVVSEIFGPIPGIFLSQGEEGFRQMETQILTEIGKQSSLILATGGGCVTRPENYDILHQNGQIFYIQRALESLSSEGRPLSQARGAAELYRQRQDLYPRFADHTVDNNTTPEACAQQILDCWEALE